jgi:hypothetical protein
MLGPPYPVTVAVGSVAQADSHIMAMAAAEPQIADRFIVASQYPVVNIDFHRRPPPLLRFGQPVFLLVSYGYYPYPSWTDRYMLWLKEL